MIVWQTTGSQREVATITRQKETTRFLLLSFYSTPTQLFLCTAEPATVQLTKTKFKEKAQLEKLNVF